MFGRRRVSFLAAGAMAVAIAVSLGQQPSPTASAPATRPAKSVRVLTDRNVPATPEGIARFLTETRATAQPGPATDALIRQLGDDDWKKREEASQKLMELPLLPEAALQKALESPDVEVQIRAKAVLSRARASSILPAVQAALEVVAENKMKGLASLVIDTAATFATDRPIQAAAARALAASAGPEDLQTLRQAARHAAAPVRLLAIEGLKAVLTDNASREIKPLLADGDEDVRLRAAVELCDVGDRDVLAALGKLLESDKPVVRDQAVRLLRALTGQNIEFVANADAAQRAKGAAQWKAWLETEGKTAKLNFPLSRAVGSLARFAFCVYGVENRVVILDADKKELAKFNLPPQFVPWAIHLLDNGNVLVGSSEKHAVVEYDQTGKELWKKEDLPDAPMSVRRLANGNVLTALADSGLVTEISPDGKVVWQVKQQGRPAWAERLDDGRTLIALHRAGADDRVVELDKDGKVLWKLGNLNDPQSAQRLPNGNTLVALTNAGEVAEYDKDGKKVWSHAGFQLAFDARRLANGNTLVVDSGGLHEIDPKGGEVWKLAQSSVSRVSARN